MNDKEIQIMEASLRILGRYGIKRATMGDIAKEADISRQTLYASFANKDEIIVAALHYFSTKTQTAVLLAWETQSDLSEKLDTFFQLEIRNIFEMVRNSPDAEELTTGANTETRAAIKCVYMEKQNMLARLFAPYQDAIVASGQNLDDFAYFVQSSAINFKHSADNLDDLNRLLASLQSMVLLTTRAT
jgi:AcrR family transcriptional regulator